MYRHRSETSRAYVISIGGRKNDLDYNLSINSTVLFELHQNTISAGYSPLQNELKFHYTCLCLFGECHKNSTDSPNNRSNVYVLLNEKLKPTILSISILCTNWAKTRTMSQTLKKQFTDTRKKVAHLLIIKTQRKIDVKKSKEKSWTKRKRKGDASCWNISSFGIR